MRAPRGPESGDPLWGASETAVAGHVWVHCRTGAEARYSGSEPFLHRWRHRGPPPGAPVGGTRRGSRRQPSRRGLFLPRGLKPRAGRYSGAFTLVSPASKRTPPDRLAFHARNYFACYFYRENNSLVEFLMGSTITVAYKITAQTISLFRSSTYLGGLRVC